MDVDEAIYVINHEYELPEEQVDRAWRTVSNFNQKEIS